MTVPAKSPEITDSVGEMMASARLALFDLDDTLCDYAGARHLRLQQAFNLACTEAALAHDDYPDIEHLIDESITIHPHGADHFIELLGTYGLHETAAIAARRWYRANRFHGLALFAETIDVLVALRRHGRALGVITNGPADVQRAKVELLEIERWVDFTIISGEFGVEKPDPRIFHAALTLAGVDASETVFVGDSPDHDMVGAHAVGIPTIWMNPTKRTWTQSSFAPDAVITSLSALLERESP